jgi:glutaredoxin
MIRKITVYSLPCCPRCDELKSFLGGAEMAFTEANMEEPAAITDLRVEGCFAVEAPVLQIVDGDKIFFYESNTIFPKGKLDGNLVIEAVGD